VKTLGIDPGLAITGYGILEQDGERVLIREAGTIEGGPSSDALPERLRALFRQLDELIQDHRPEVIARSGGVPIMRMQRT